ncbi:MAG: dihydrolipoyl dehydrogenase [Pseudomonadota bacterium]
MVETAHFDAVVIGSGPGGYVAGIRLGQLGVKTLVVERERVGGVCLNVGCIPSKALVHASKTLDRIRRASELGISLPAAPTIDWPATMKWKDGVVNRLTSGVRQLLKASGTALWEGDATVQEGGGKVAVRRADGSTAMVTAANVIIATGSRPLAIPALPVDHQRVLDSTDVLALQSIPGRMVVVGGGYIGMEIGTVYAKLGTKVTIVEALPSVMAGMDSDCVQVITRKLRKQGVDILVSSKVVGWEDKGDRAVVSIQNDKGSATIDTDKILVTVGRRPNTDGADLERLGLETDQKGAIIVDERQSTGKPGLYAIGDCTVGPMLAHKASAEAEVVAEVIAGRTVERSRRTIPSATFTDPEFATVGLTEEQARAAGRQIKVGKFPFAALGRALAQGETDGLVKIVADAETNLVLGMHIAGAAAGDMISEGALAIDMEARLQEIAHTIHPHPTFPEATMEAARAALGQAIHIVNR